jgi:hypothetical protein
VKYPSELLENVIMPPKSTISDKISRSDLDTNMGRQPALPKLVED